MGRPLSETNKIQPAGFAPEQLMAIDPTPLAWWLPHRPGD